MTNDKQKNRLVELLKKKYDHFCDQCGVNKDSHYTDNLADYLLANGVIVPPCKVGDLVYALWEAPIPEKYVVYVAEVKEISIKKRNCRLAYNYILMPLCFSGRTREYLDEDFGKLIFLTKEEAEEALKGGGEE